MATQGKRQDHVTEVRLAVTELLGAYRKLINLRQAWDWEFNSSLVDASGRDQTAGDYDPGDFMGANAGLLRADITDVYNAVTAIGTVMNDGHGTNLERVKL